MLAKDIIGTPACERTALAAVEAPELAAPTTATTPALTRLLAPSVATCPLAPPESA